jgi:hypothetical protein
MNVMIRGALVALSLAGGVVPMAYAGYGTPQQPAATQEITQDTTTVPASRRYAGQSPMALGASDRPAIGNTRMPTRKAPIQSGNDFNFLEGGGG